jgi:hypothetical protein
MHIISNIAPCSSIHIAMPFLGTAMAFTSLIAMMLIVH